MFPSLSNLNNITFLKFAKQTSQDKWAVSNVVSALTSKEWSETERISLELIGLTEINDLSNILNKFNTTSLKIKNCNNVLRLDGIGNMFNLETLTLQNNSGFISLDGISLLSGLTKLVMNNCSVTDLSELRNMTSLNYIDLKNSIFSGGENLKILAGLRENNSNLKLYLSGCSNVLDWSPLEKFTNWWHSDEKAGYN